MGDFPAGFGRYQLVERLAVGGMAELFLATAPGEHGFQKKVVIKRLLPHLIADDNYTAMFIDEAKLTARLVHPKIAQTFELGKVDDALYIAMEFVDGIDVLALLREFATRKRRIEPQLAAWIAHEVLDALDYAHNSLAEDGRAMGIVHRDISPSNVLLSMRGDIKLVDFGIARAQDPERSHKSKSGTLKGKYGYMSPEQVLEQPLDARSDLFSVGVVLAELLTGRRLFAAANELDVLLMVRDAKLARLDKYGADIEVGLNEIVRKALKKPLDERYASAAAFRDAIAEWLFVSRHRMTSAKVAEVVAQLREVVVDRRRKAAMVAAGDDLAIGRAPSESDVPQLIVDDERSMPVITYEGVPSEDKLQRAFDAVQPIAPSESMANVMT
ncbi:MAG: serine/threonine protein kinase, partial [Deltaproteobacteria bacterium]|nr:serine/threonine protein kinase [Deltaproteobacteria bacterium]